MYIIEWVNISLKSSRIILWQYSILVIHSNRTFPFQRIIFHIFFSSSTLYAFSNTQNLCMEKENEEFMKKEFSSVYLFFSLHRNPHTDKYPCYQEDYWLLGKFYFCHLSRPQFSWGEFLCQIKQRKKKFFQRVFVLVVFPFPHNQRVFSSLYIFGVFLSAKKQLKMMEFFVVS